MTIAHPFRLDPDGAVVTIPQGSPAHAAQVAGHVLACVHGERALAPTYGIADPIGIGLDEDIAVAAIDTAEPDVLVLEIGAEIDADGRMELELDVTWATSDDTPSTIGADVP